MSSPTHIILWKGNILPLVKAIIFQVAAEPNTVLYNLRDDYTELSPLCNLVGVKQVQGAGEFLMCSDVTPTQDIINKVVEDLLVLIKSHYISVTLKANQTEIINGNFH